jgi:hypothetical protein
MLRSVAEGIAKGGKTIQEKEKGVMQDCTNFPKTME